ncbi:thiol:disulfide interchange protein DsbA/DsbL [Massilia horti]|uniref:thiol:disulfide interchange protein DsbA/DsbL n=1 Tax=Massilia horti TaxID=2562153 RepID=UPI0027D9430E|nr:thiol:disulfide interchange protein DsbA/DsbL [Massilia horti]
MLSLFAGAALASPANPVDGVDYTTLSAPQPTQATGKKVEVIEFFMYHCPVCNALEPAFEEWVRKQGERIALRRVHVPYTGPNDPEAHLFLTLEAMGRLGDMHEKVFHARHVERQRLKSDEDMINWAAKNGIDRDKFVEVWSSFGVTTKLRRLSQVMQNYGVDSAPTLVIDGRYMTSPSMVRNGASDQAQVFRATLQVADALVAKAAQSK